MSVPKYYEFYGVFLKLLEDGNVHYMKDIKQEAAKMMSLSDEDLSELLPSGMMSVYENRLGWARTYLKKAGLIDSPARGQFVITEEGSKALPDIDSINDKYLMKYPAFREFFRPSKQDSTDQGISDELSPEEVFEQSFSELNASLAGDLMTEIMKLSSVEFEKLVVKMLVKMGYGSGIDDAGVVTQASNDGGIDGIIKEDQLGFSSIYIQAKQWATDRTVDRPEIDRFLGALTRKHANKGLFITTATFTSGAKAAASDANIVLVDGKALTKLMIKYNFGVSVERTYEVKRIDSDFFADGF